MSAPRIALTGATGFIGRAVLRALQGSGADVVTIGRQAVDGVRAEHCRADLLRDDPEEIFGRVRATHLLHLAWYAEPGLYWRAPVNLDWVAASLRLFRAFAASGGTRAVLAGSCAEYDWVEGPLNETRSAIRPATLYGAAKAHLTDLLQRAAPDMGLSFASGRIFFPFGPDERSERLLGTLIKAGVEGTTAMLSAGTQRRDFIHVDDLASGLLALLHSDVEGPVNIGSGVALPVRRFVEIAIEGAPWPISVEFGARPLAPGEPVEVVADMSRLRDEVGFSPSATVEDRIRDAMRVACLAAGKAVA
ncbi:NAD-dependent epimerase/dehydratase family protein [Sphingomonas kyeonggiensis]|uniref:NAD-dependent epimerase/dehydratase family protein n=1 Tax=Sphingomonas kyeonggiensis TaxID=1268553 RepID=UPI001614489F|nr:NAD(P)-dependent oxidoreductase [Sphingomonas kyeonggiensis]